MKKRNAATKVFVVLLALLPLTGCVTLDSPVMTRVIEGGERTVEIQAGRYEFAPNNIEALEGDRIVFLITNAEDKEHNFTILNPAGEQVQSVDLPPITTVSIRVALLDAGTYQFYCNKPFHKMLGMKGQLSAAPH